MTVALDGRSLALADVVAVRAGRGAGRARAGGDRGDARIATGVEQAVARGERIYGVSTAAGALQRVALDGSDAHQFNRTMLLNCRVGQGPPASREIVRGTLLRLANNLAHGVTGVRPELAEVVVRRSTRTGR